MRLRRDTPRGRLAASRSRVGAARAADFVALGVIAGGLVLGAVVVAHGDPLAVLKAAIGLVGLAESMP